MHLDMSIFLLQGNASAQKRSIEELARASLALASMSTNAAVTVLKL